MAVTFISCYAYPLYNVKNGQNQSNITQQHDEGWLREEHTSSKIDLYNIVCLWTHLLWLVESQYE